MIRNLWKEEWKLIQFDEKISTLKKFKISNYGRVIYLKGDDEVLRNKSFINGYETIALKQELNNKGTCRYVHKLVAQHFLEKENEDQVFVLHINYDKTDNTLENL